MGPRIPLLIGACAVLATLWPAPAPAAASCSAGVRFHEAFYSYAETRDRVARGATLRGGVRPGCDDTIVLGPDGQRLDEPPRATPVELRRLRGVPARLAVSQAGLPGVFLAPGTFPQLPRHPLHRALYRSRRAPDETQRRTCGPPHVVRGALSVVPFAGSWMTIETAAGTAVPVVADAGTRIRRARSIAAQPVLGAGDALRVVGRRCAGDGEQPLVALRIRVTPAG